MARRPDPRRKTRTRGHVIADLGVNHVERHVLLAGFTAERFHYDYSYDLTVKTYSPTGEIEPDSFEFQVKATDRLVLHADGATAVVRVDGGDVRSWLLNRMPVILALYDATADRAYWVDVQEHARARKFGERGAGKTVTVRVPVAQVLTPAAVHAFRLKKTQASAGQL